MKTIYAIATAAVALVSIVSPTAIGDHPDNCVPATAGEVVVTVGGFLATFQPHCAQINSGEQVRWTNLDAFNHNPGDTNGGDCWRTTDSGEELGSTENFRAVFEWDATASRVVVSAWLGDEQVTWTDPVTGQPITEKTCDEDTYIDQGSSVFIPYICWIHQNMNAGIVLNK